MTRPPLYKRCLLATAFLFSSAAGDPVLTVVTPQPSSTAALPVIREREPNNDDATAMLVQPGTTIDAALTAGIIQGAATDNDRYRVPVVSPGLYTITVTPTLPECEYWVGLLGARRARGPTTMTVELTGQSGRTHYTERLGGRPELRSTTSSEPRELLFWVNTQAWSATSERGVQCVEGGAWHKEVPYRLTVTAGAPVLTAITPPSTAVGPVIREQEPNHFDAPAMLVLPGTTVDAALTAGIIQGTATDQDRYRVPVASPGLYTITVTPTLPECEYWVGLPGLRRARGPSTMTAELTGQRQTHYTMRFGGQPEERTTTSGEPRELIIMVDTQAYSATSERGVQCVAGGPWYREIPYRLTVTAGRPALTVNTPPSPPPVALTPTPPPVAPPAATTGAVGKVAPAIPFGEPAVTGRISNIVTASDVRRGAAVDITDSFGPDVNPIHVWFRLSGFAPGTKLDSRWTYLGGPAPLMIGTGEFTIAPTNDYGTFSYELAAGKRWPAGGYRIEVLLDGAVLGSATFVVRPAEPSVPSARTTTAAPAPVTTPPPPTTAAPPPTSQPTARPESPAAGPTGSRVQEGLVPGGLVPGGLAIPTATLADDNVCDQSRWPAGDVPWQSPSGPPVTKGEGMAASVAPPLDFATLTSVQYGGAVSAAVESMRLVYGPLSTEDTARFEKKWAPLLDFPTAEIVAYLNQLNPLLGQFLVARSGYAAAANGLFAALHDGGLAMAYGSEEGTADGWRQAGVYRDLMASYEVKLRELVAAIQTLGNPPNPYDLKCRARQRAKEALSIFEATGRATFRLFVEEQRLSRVMSPQICSTEGTRPLVGATVVVDGPTKAAAVSDASGTASVSSLAPGRYRVRILDPDGRDLDVVSRTFRAEHPVPTWPGGRRTSMDFILCDDTLAGASRLPPRGLDEFVLDAKTPGVVRTVAFGANLFGIDLDPERMTYIEGLQKAIAQRDAMLTSGFEIAGGTPMTPARRQELQAMQHYQSNELRYEQGLRGLTGRPPASGPRTNAAVSTTKPESPAPLSAAEMAAVREYIQTITRRVAAYDKQLASETDDERRKQLEFLKMMAVTEIQQEQARLRPASDGQPAFIRTALGDYIRQAEYRKSVEEAARSQVLGRVWTAIDKQIAILPSDIGDNWKTVVNERANRRGTSVEDVEKAEQALLSVANTVQDYWGRKAGKQLERVEYYDWVENKVDTFGGMALVGLSGPAAVAMFGPSALVMNWAPRAAGFVYGGVTGYQEGGPVEGVKNALAWTSLVTFVGVEAYNGYEQEMAKSGDVRTAALAGTTQGLEAYAVGKLFEKTFQYGARLYGRAGPATPATPPRINLARYKQELLSADQKVAAFKRVSRELDDALTGAGGDPDRLRALKQIQQEAAADINASYQAKLRLKYVDKQTGRAYTEVMETVYDDLADPIMKALEANGYDVSKLRLKPVRNASSDGSVGMDFDLSLVEATRSSSKGTPEGPGLIIRKNGERVSALTLEKDAQAILNDVYFKRMGRNPEKSFLNFTTHSHPEAYSNLAWLGDDVTKKINFDGIDASALQAGEVTAFKARHAINTTSLSEVSRVQEATRGLAKDVNTKVVPYIDYKLKAAEAAGDAAGTARLRALKAQWTTIGAEYQAVGTTVGDASSLLSRLLDLEARGLGVTKVINVISSHMEVLSKLY